jgi:ferrochelatase
MSARADHILVIGFGGPERPEDVRPFLEEVTRGLRIPPQRLEAVAHHYADTGGASPYNRLTRQQVERLTERLRAAGVELPIFLGMRTWHPFLRDVLPALGRSGLQHGIGLVLAPHRSHASFEKYLETIDQVRRDADGPTPSYEYVGPWHTDEGFIAAQADHARRALAELPLADRDVAWLVFTAHSIPTEMAQRSRYAEEFRASSRLVAEALGIPRWRLAYQSRSGDPRQPWLEPDVDSALEALAGEGARAVVLVPIGFLCDHTEVLYDLDLEAAQAAARRGLRCARASTVMDHPRFIDALAQHILRHLR